MPAQTFRCCMMIFILCFQIEGIIAGPFLKDKSDAKKAGKKSKPVMSVGVGFKLMNISTASDIKSPLFKNNIPAGVELVFSNKLKNNFHLISNFGFAVLDYDQEAYNKTETFMKVTDGAIYDTRRSRETGFLTIGNWSEALSYKWYSKAGILQPYIRMSMYVFDYSTEKLFYRTYASSTKREYIYIDAHKSKLSFVPSAGVMYSLPVSRIVDIFANADFGYIIGTHSYAITIYSSDGSVEKYKEQIVPFRTVGSLSIGLKFNIYKYLNY